VIAALLREHVLSEVHTLCQIRGAAALGCRPEDIEIRLEPKEGKVGLVVEVDPEKCKVTGDELRERVGVVGKLFSVESRGRLAGLSGRRGA